MAALVNGGSATTRALSTWTLMMQASTDAWRSARRAMGR